MQWFQLIAALLPVAEQVFKAISDAIAAGKAPSTVHQNIVDHVAVLPGIIRTQ